MVSANPTGPILVSAARNGAYGDCVARLLDVRRRTRSSASTTTTTPARQMERFRALGRGARGAASRCPRTATTATYVVELAGRGRSGPARCSRRSRQTLERFRIHFDSWALQSDRRAAAGRAACRVSTRTSRTARSGHAVVRTTVTTRTRVLVRSAEQGGDADVPRGRRSRTSSTSSSAASIARSTCSAPTITATTKWYAAIARDARLRPRARRGAAVPVRAPDERRRADEDVEARGATSSSSTTSWTRSASTPRAGTSSTAGPTRRSRSISTWRPRSRRRTPSTTCSTRTRVSRRSSGTPKARRSAATRPEPLVAEEKELIKRLTDFPATVREAVAAPRAAAAPGVRDPARRRLPSLLPRVPRARRPGRGVPARSLCGHAACDRPQPRPGRRRGSRADVNATLSNLVRAAFERGSRVRRAVRIWLEPSRRARETCGSANARLANHVRTRRRRDG